MVSTNFIAATVLASVAMAAESQNPLVMSMADQVVSGLVAARNDGVPESKAQSECNEIMTQLVQNKDISGMLNDAASMVKEGINSDGFTSFISNALKSFSHFQDSDDFKSIDALVSKNAEDLNTDKALPSVSSAMSLVINMVTPTISQMAKTDSNVAAAASTGIAAAEAVLHTLKLVPEATGSSDKNSTVTDGPKSASSGSGSAVSTSAASSSHSNGTATSATTTSTGAAERNAVAGIAMGGVLAAGALLL